MLTTSRSISLHVVRMIEGRVTMDIRHEQIWRCIVLIAVVQDAGTSLDEKRKKMMGGIASCRQTTLFCNTKTYQ